ncbi:adhesin [Alteromonas sediminis]|uniref:Adhesin n=1 Tax=Alteromonas sediminis TaxID=2259342 RepID=A0A3N5Y2C4_9ALTE|nr:fasciclin domain-containing protein [Alteromonas sediminis]RPJ67490.1 adhesin [Alteromonas sediminis]
MNRKSLLPASLLIAGLMVGCSSDSNDLPEVSPPPPPPPPPPATTIVDVAASNEDFETLVAALEAANLVETLDDENATFTVFAPTDDAFALLGQETLDALLADPENLLAPILTYHVLDGEVDADAAIAAAGSTVETLNGASVGLSLAGDDLLVNTSTVITTNIETDNGIIHVIDAVLMPPMPTDASGSTIVDVALADDRFETLVAALTQADLVSTLADPDANFTVFAPTDDAFAKIDSDTLGALIEDFDALRAVLLQHVVLDAAVDSVTAFSLAGTDVETASGALIPTAINQETDTLTIGGANVVITDIVTDNGIIHVIDSVIIGDVELPTPATTIVDVAAGNENFSTLVSLLQATGLDAALDDASADFTVFAPTNAAFDALDPELFAALGADPEALSNVLLYHVAEGSVASDAALMVAQGDDSLVEMLNGESTALSLSGSDLYINTSLVSSTDIMADNGIIHVVDQVIVPPTSIDASSQTVAEYAAGNDNFSTLVTALDAAGLVSALADPDATFTVFAPTNAAFAKIDSDALNALLADTPALTSVLLQHVINTGAINSVSAFAANGSTVNTMADEDVAVDIVNFANATNDMTSEVAYDTSSGLLVGGMGSSQPGFTLYTFDNDLGGSGSACVDSCADVWPPVMVTDGTVSGVPGLGMIDRGDGNMQATFQGRPLYFFANDAAAGDTDGKGVNDVWDTVAQPQTALTIQGSIVTTTDVVTSNGIIHVIDTVITETLD